jgi:tetratricopeptide (TPR) repeat protein
MGIFSKKNKHSRPITEADQTWIEDSFTWLVDVVGLPYNLYQYELNIRSFPNSFDDSSFSPETFTEDVLSLMELSQLKITIEYSKGILDLYDPIGETQSDYYGVSFEKSLDGYHIVVPTSLLEIKSHLIFNLIFVLTEINLVEFDLQYNIGEDVDLFIHLAAAYFGFGLIILDNKTSIGSSQNSFKESKWSYVSSFPDEVLLYAIAFHALLTGSKQELMSYRLSNQNKLLLDEIILFQKAQKIPFTTTKEIKCNRLIITSNQLANNLKYKEAFESLQQAIAYNMNTALKTDVYNNMGYYLLLLGENKESIRYFEKSLDLNRGYAFPMTNLAFVYLQLKDTEKAKYWLRKADATEGTDPGFVHRNYGILNHQEANFSVSEFHFKEALKLEQIKIEVIYLFYAQLLIDMGKTEEAIIQLKLGKDRGEMDSLQLLNDLTDSK